MTQATDEESTKGSREASDGGLHWSALDGNDACPTPSASIRKGDSQTEDGNDAASSDPTPGQPALAASVAHGAGLGRILDWIDQAPTVPAGRDLDGQSRETTSAEIPPPGGIGSPAPPGSGIVRTPATSSLPTDAVPLGVATPVRREQTTPSSADDDIPERLPLLGLLAPRKYISTGTSPDQSGMVSPLACCMPERRGPVTENFAYDEEERQWTFRRTRTGVVCRLVEYEKHDVPPWDDVSLRGGSGRPVVVNAVRDQGIAYMAGVRAGDRLVSVNGNKDFLNLPAEAIRQKLVSPTVLVFVGFVGSMNAEVRIPVKDEGCGISPKESVLEFPRSGAPVAVHEGQVFDTRGAPLFLEVEEGHGAVDEHQAMEHKRVFELGPNEAHTLVRGLLRSKNSSSSTCSFNKMRPPMGTTRSVRAACGDPMPMPPTLNGPDPPALSGTVTRLRPVLVPPSDTKPVDLKRQDPTPPQTMKTSLSSSPGHFKPFRVIAPASLTSTSSPCDQSFDEAHLPAKSAMSDGPHQDDSEDTDTPVPVRTTTSSEDPGTIRA